MREKHVHRFQKKTYSNGTKMFFCTLPDCYFKVETDFALGKEAICNVCGEPFIMNEKSCKLLRPHCSSCGRRAVMVDGKKHFINVRRGGKLLTSIAADEVSSLRDRLNSIVKPDEDI